MTSVLQRYVPTSIKFILLPAVLRLFLRYRYGCKLLGYEFFGLNNLDAKLIEIIGHHQSYFVEIGANDGFTASNTKNLELFHNWRGVLIEPIPDQARRCRTHRRKTTKIFEAACVSFEYAEPTIELIYSDTMTIALGGVSDIIDREGHAKSGIQFLSNADETYKFHALARTMTSILEEAKSPRQMGLLSLDVEGGELEVLRGIDHARFRFDWILLESRNISQVKEFLSQNAYHFHEKLGEHDYLFKDLSEI
jgi:FkbM family methyltransferase